jgi:hypothetical protein
MAWLVLIEEKPESLNSEFAIDELVESNEEDSDAV